MAPTIAIPVPMTDSQTPTFPDHVYAEQAEYLADHTPLTKQEAEAYLRRSHTPDDRHADDYVSQRRLATKMNIGESAFSNYLSSAREKLDEDAATLDALKTLLAVTDMGGVNGHSRRVIGSRTTKNAFVLISETPFYDREQYSYPSRYKAHLVYSEQEPDVDFDELPDDIIHYDKHSVFTVQSSGKDHFVNSVNAYMTALDALDAYDRHAALDLLDDLDFPASNYKKGAADAVAEQLGRE